MNDGGAGMIPRTGLSADVAPQVRRKPEQSTRRSNKRVFSFAIIALVSVASLAYVFSPVDTSSAAPSREENCTSCHDQIVETLLTVTGLPAQYTPGALYTITIQVNDLNDANGENGFYMISDGGVFSNAGPNAEVNTDTTASTIDTRPRTESSWTVDWTAPISGTVNIHVYAVSATDTLTGKSAPSDDDIITTSSGTPIPEFSVLILPILGTVIVMLGVARLSKKTKL